MFERYGFGLMIAAAVLVGTGVLWLVIVAFRQRFLWGLGVLVFLPLGLLFAAKYPRRGVPPWLMILAGLAVAGGTVASGYVLTHHVDLGPRDKIVNSERHLTLTGWDGTDYAVLKERPDTVVLQLANPDVTDQTLEYLKGMSELRELDLNGTQITDVGLGIVAELPALRELRLARTKITDEGFREHLADRQPLRMLELTGTAVAGKTKREWKNAAPERRLLD